MRRNSRVSDDEYDEEASFPYDTSQTSIDESFLLIFLHMFSEEEFEREPESDFSCESAGRGNEEAFPRAPDNTAHYLDNFVSEELKETSSNTISFMQQLRAEVKALFPGLRDSLTGGKDMMIRIPIGMSHPNFKLYTQNMPYVQ